MLKNVIMQIYCTYNTKKGHFQGQTNAFCNLVNNLSIYIAIPMLSRVHFRCMLNLASFELTTTTMKFPQNVGASEVAVLYTNIFFYRLFKLFYYINLIFMLPYIMCFIYVNSCRRKWNSCFWYAASYNSLYMIGLLFPTCPVCSYKYMGCISWNFTLLVQLSPCRKYSRCVP